MNRIQPIAIVTIALITLPTALISTAGAMRVIE
jgi:hypothetical protein